MPITENKLKEIMLYLVDNGETETLKKYKLKHDTLRRYKDSARFETTKIPKVLLLDIETTPMEVFVWGLFVPGKRISHENIIKSWNCVSWSAKWLFSSEVMSDVLTPEESRKRDDRRILKSVWKLLEDADIVIGHNGDKFDIPRLNTRFILNGMHQPTPYQTIDTLKVSRKFSFASNRLDYLGDLVRRKGKVKTDFKLWTRCVAGDREALDYMVAYNREDVLLLEEVYVWLRPWIKSHPNMGLYIDSDKEVCGNCGSDDIEWGGTYATSVNKYSAFRCNNCKTTGRCRISALSKEKRKQLTTTLAR